MLLVQFSKRSLLLLLLFFLVRLSFLKLQTFRFFLWFFYYYIFYTPLLPKVYICLISHTETKLLLAVWLTLHLSFLQFLELVLSHICNPYITFQLIFGQQPV